jgi:hypothetical protein
MGFNQAPKENFMTPRRIVERFDEVTWTSQPGQFGRTYSVVFKADGERESFSAAIPLSLSTGSDALGRNATDEDWEAAVRMKIMDLVSNGLLDSWPPSQTMLLAEIDYRELDNLFANAKRKGLTKA